MVNGKTRTLGLIGNPIEHTLSPIIHNFLSKELDVNAMYLPFLVESSSLEDAIKGAYSLNIKGLNVTVPHKEQVMNHLLDIDNEAKEIGAVNTLQRIQGGFKGYNTDINGLWRGMLQDNVQIEGKNVVILGAGGAAKAVAYLCAREKASKIYLLNRTLSKARELANSINNIYGLDLLIPMAMDEYTSLPNDRYLVFQTTSIGLHPNNEDVVINDEEFYKKVDIGIDLIYNPKITKFMEKVTDSGGTSYNGLKMLLYQAIIAYELWNDVKVTDEVAYNLYNILLDTFN